MATVVNGFEDKRFGNLGRGLGNAFVGFQQKREQEKEDARRQKIMIATINSGAGAGKHTSAEAAKIFQKATAGMDVKKEDFDSFIQMQQKSRETVNQNVQAKATEKGKGQREEFSQRAQNMRNANTNRTSAMNTEATNQANILRTKLKIDADIATAAKGASTAGATKEFSAKDATIADAALRERGLNPEGMEPTVLRSKRGEALQNVESLERIRNEVGKQFDLPANATQEMINLHMSKKPEKAAARNRALSTADQLTWMGVSEGVAIREAMAQSNEVPTAKQTAEGTKLQPLPISVLGEVSRDDVKSSDGKIQRGSYGIINGTPVKFQSYNKKAGEWEVRILR